MPGLQLPWTDWLKAIGRARVIVVFVFMIAQK